MTSEELREIEAGLAKLAAGLEDTRQTAARFMPAAVGPLLGVLVGMAQLNAKVAGEVAQMREELDLAVPGTPCPECLGARFRRLRHADSSELIMCTACAGSGRG